MKKILLIGNIFAAFLMLMIPNISAVNAQNTNEIIQKNNEILKSGNILTAILFLLDTVVGAAGAIFGLVFEIPAMILVGLASAIFGVLVWFNIFPDETL